METVWIVLAYVMIGQYEMASTNIHYAFKDKATCESTLVELKDVRCVELKVIK